MLDCTQLTCDGHVHTDLSTLPKYLATKILLVNLTYSIANQIGKKQERKKGHHLLWNILAYCGHLLKDISAKAMMSQLLSWRKGSKAFLVILHMRKIVSNWMTYTFIDFFLSTPLFLDICIWISQTWCSGYEWVNFPQPLRKFTWVFFSTMTVPHDHLLCCGGNCLTEHQWTLSIIQTYQLIHTHTD